ncbi:MAG: hypothetical protein WCL06_16465, partial [Bacteroidota bacterium]
IDTTYNIDNIRFDSIVLLTNKLSSIDTNNANIRGKDGTWCILEFGTSNNKTSFSFWTPNYYTKYRGLSGFMDICTQIILIANLKPQEIF